jgi:TATA-binding protein-associated factor Taf7
MARGWESKAIEDQQAEAAAEKRQTKARLTADEIKRQQEIQGLELSRQRVRQQLLSATNPQHREMLQLALAELESKLSLISP